MRLDIHLECIMTIHMMLKVSNEDAWQKAGWVIIIIKRDVWIWNSNGPTVVDQISLPTMPETNTIGVCQVKSDRTCFLLKLPDTFTEVKTVCGQSVEYGCDHNDPNHPGGWYNLSCGPIISGNIGN